MKSEGKRKRDAEWGVQREIPFFFMINVTY